MCGFFGETERKIAEEKTEKKERRRKKVALGKDAEE